MRVSIGSRILELQQGDITKVEADVIVNAANAMLAGGGGVDGAIHRAAGPTVMDECRKIGACPTGTAVYTRAGNLNAKWIFHAVGPIWTGGTKGEPLLLQSAYKACFDLCDLLRAQTMALPAISTGIYRYPMKNAAEIAIQTAIAHLEKRTWIQNVIFVLFDHAAFNVFSESLPAVTK